MEFHESNLLFQEESPHVEWKESDRNEGEILHAVCALANDLDGSGQPGYLVLGVANSGRVTGVDVSDGAIQRHVSRLRSTKILPNPSVVVTPLERDGKHVVVIRVDPYPVPPVVMVNGVPWVRIGTSTHRAMDADVARLRERRPEKQLPFDQRTVPGAVLDDLDLARLREEHRATRESGDDPDSFPALESWLRQREIVRGGATGWFPTGAGLLIYGIDPHRLIPGAMIELVRYAGTGFDDDVVHRKTIFGSVPDQLDAIWAQLQIHIVDVPAPESGMRTPFVAEYPLEALRELARNLVQHRLYEGTNAPGRISWMEDRIVFNNPGARFGRASEGAFGEHSDYRNPTLTRFLADLGYVERLGRGIVRARKELERNGNPPLEAETDGFTTVVVRRRR